MSTQFKHWQCAITFASTLAEASTIRRVQWIHGGYVWVVAW